MDPGFKRESYRFKHTRIQSKKNLTIIKVAESFLIKTPPTVNGAISKEKYHGMNHPIFIAMNFAAKF